MLINKLKIVNQFMIKSKQLNQTLLYTFWFNKTVGTGNTLFERAGGKSVVEKSMRDFKMMMRENPELEHYFIWKDEKKYVPGSQAYAVNSLGGPHPYTGRNLRVSHRALKITNHYFDIAMESMEKAFMKNGVDQQTARDIVKHFEEYRAEITNKYINPKKDEEMFEKYYNEDWKKSVEREEQQKQPQHDDIQHSKDFQDTNEKKE
ncbi:hypothetical protein ABPG73_020354 [Tetrahymena malaccensis]